MKIYEIQGSRFDGCDDWRETVGLYINKDKADWECALLEEAKLDSNTNYYVWEVEVNEDVL